jgi:flagellar protein FlgJ
MQPAENIQKKSELQKYFPDLYSGKTSTSNVKFPKDIEKEIASDPEKKKLYDTAVEFQSLFINMMLKSMRANLNKKNDLLHAGMKQDIFESMLYDEYAKEMSKDKRFDLAKTIYEQLSENMNSSERSEALRNYESNLKTPIITGEQMMDNRF